MDWTLAQQARFDALRYKALIEALTPAEQTELEELNKLLETLEEHRLSPYLTHLAAEQVALQYKLRNLQQETQTLAQVYQQLLVIRHPLIPNN